MNQFLFIFLILANLTLFFFLFWQPRKKRKIQKQGLYFQSSMGPIFYQVHGKKKKKKKTILLLHGLGASSYCWRKLIPLLEDDFRIVTMDLWGFGKSSKANHKLMTLDMQINTIFELLDELEIKKVHVIGNSMGAQLGFWMAKKFPKHIKTVVAIAPATYPKLVPQYISRARWISKLTPFVVSHNFVRTMVIGVLGNPHNITTEMVNAYHEPYKDPLAHHTFASSLNILEDERVYNSLTGIETPVLTLWGERDRVIPRYIIDDIVSKLPYTQLQTHPKSGHCPMEEHPEWCAEHIIPFLKS